MKKLLIILALFALAPTAQAATIGSVQSNNIGLVGYWTLDGSQTSWATGRSNDSSGQGNTGSLIGMSTSTAPTSGKVGQGLNFDGADDYIQTTVNSSVSSATFAVWMKRTVSQPSYTGVLFSRGANVSGLGFTITNQLGYTWNNAAETYNWFSGLVPPQNEWTFVVLTVTPTEATMYMGTPSGGLQSATNVVSHSASQINDLKIGQDDEGGRFYVGHLDDARFYNRALSVAEIKALYNSGIVRTGASFAGANNPLSSGLLAHWTFDGGNTNWNTNTVADLSGQGNSATTSNMATSSAPVPGKIGQALRWGGGTSYVQSTALINTPTVTVSAWVYLKGYPTDCVLVAGFASGPDTPSLFDKRITVDSSGFAQFYVYDGSSISTPAAGAGLALNAWHLLTGTADGTHAKMYVNGVLVSSIPAGQTFTGYSSPNVYVGSKGSCSAYPTTGTRIDDVRIYGKALTADEVRSLYGAGGTTVGQSASPANAPLSSGLVLHLPLDGAQTNWTTNQTNDLSGNNNIGYIKGLVLGTSTAPVPGRLGQALQFPGDQTDQGIVVGYNSTVAITGPITLSVWVKTSRAETGQVLLSRWGGTNSYTLVTDVGTVRVFLSGVITTAGCGNVADGSWHLVTVSYTGAYVTTYIDGVAVCTEAASGSMTDGGQNFHVGYEGAGFGGQPYKGVMDDIRVYNRGISAAEARALYNMGR